MAEGVELEDLAAVRQAMELKGLGIRSGRRLIPPERGDPTIEILQQFYHGSNFAGLAAPVGVSLPKAIAVVSRPALPRKAGRAPF